MFGLFKKNKNHESKERKLSSFLNVGFHGDYKLIEVVEALSKNTKFFIETGTNVGSTLIYNAKKNENVHHMSCEPHYESFQFVKNKIESEKLNNISLYNLDSLSFIEELRTKEFLEKSILWVDAHGYGFEWPLREEILFFTEKFKDSYIFIDDFKVPGKEMFKWDQYNEQECSYEYISDFIQNNFNIYYPAYTEKVSEVHPLTGWCLLAHEDERILDLIRQGLIVKG